MNWKIRRRDSPLSYLIGFLLSLFSTIAAYWIVSQSLLEGWPVYSLLILLASIQIWVQLTTFLRLGQEKRPYWNLVTFLFMLSVVCIIVALSLWIMDELNYNLM
jgi:cytochrome o ubiquinol oxidase operon protein cyoD